jgi:hypothetical protein
MATRRIPDPKIGGSIPSEIILSLVKNAHLSLLRDRIRVSDTEITISLAEHAHLFYDPPFIAQVTVRDELFTALPVYCSLPDTDFQYL